MKYVTEAAKKGKPGGCLFCRLRRSGDDAGRLILKRKPNAFLMLNSFPYTSGHLMVAVGRHVGNMGDLSAAERRDLWDLAALGESAVQEVYHPEGLNVGINLGRSAGAGIDGHLHLHIVPRWHGDTNFMTTVGQTRVLPEDLGQSYLRLEKAIGPKRKRRTTKTRRTPARSSTAKRGRGSRAGGRS
jgi:ATP adenylyltransferase